MTDTVETNEPHDAASIRAWLRKNVPAGMAVMFVHPLADDPSTLDMLTVYGGGLSEELLLSGEYHGQPIDSRAAVTICNAKQLIFQLYNPAPETSSDGVPLVKP